MRCHWCGMGTDDGWHVIDCLRTGNPRPSRRTLNMEADELRARLRQAEAERAFHERVARSCMERAARMIRVAWYYRRRARETSRPD